MREVIRKLVDGEDLTRGEAADAMEQIMEGTASPAQIAGMLIALRLKGETAEEITGFARVMRERALAVPCVRKDLVDTCGTGGDRLNTFNISTTAAFVAAGAGVHVAKHGNRAASSRCGSADVLHALGVNIEMPPEAVSECVDAVGIGFLFAQRYHPSMKHAAGVRSELGVRTVFNILGPLTNPAGARRQIMGVSEAHLTETLAQVLRNLGSIHAFVCNGECGIDEISLIGPTRVTELKNGEINTRNVSPEEFGMEPSTLDDVRGGDIETNRDILLQVLRGEKGHRRNIVVVNAAAAIIAGDQARTFQEGIQLAEQSIDSGAAMGRLEALREFTHSAIA